MADWVKIVTENKIPFIKNSSLISVAGNKVKIENWKALYNLPNDDFSIENGIIMDYTLKWPLCIDPQLQASIFIKKMCLDQRTDGHRLVIATDEKLIKELEMAIKTGKWFIIENLSEKLPAGLEYIVAPDIKKRGKTKIIKFEDREIEYDDGFKLIMVSALINPH